MSQDRRNDFDVTNAVQVSKPAAVRDAVHELFADTFPGASFDKLWLAFHDFERLFTGNYPGYLGCEIPAPTGVNIVLPECSIARGR